MPSGSIWSNFLFSSHNILIDPVTISVVHLEGGT
jgi:hypothetical protein